MASDRDLGMDRPITRRDFLQGATATALAGAALGADILDINMAASSPPSGPAGALAAITLVAMVATLVVFGAVVGITRFVSLGSICAGIVLVREAGGFCADIDGAGDVMATGNIMMCPGSVDARYQATPPNSRASVKRSATESR